MDYSFMDTLLGKMSNSLQFQLYLKLFLICEISTFKWFVAIYCSIFFHMKFDIILNLWFFFSQKIFAVFLLIFTILSLKWFWTGPTFEPRTRPLTCCTTSSRSWSWTSTDGPVATWCRPATWPTTPAGPQRPQSGQRSRAPPSSGSTTHQRILQSHQREIFNLGF